MEPKPTTDPVIRKLMDHHRAAINEGVSASPAPGRVQSSLPKFFENRLALSVAETALALGVSQKSVERLIKKGNLRAKNVGRRKIIPISEIETWLTH